MPVTFKLIFCRNRLGAFRNNDKSLFLTYSVVRSILTLRPQVICPAYNRIYLFEVHCFRNVCHRRNIWRGFRGNTLLVLPQLAYMCFVSSLESPRTLETCKQLCLVSINLGTRTSSTPNELGVSEGSIWYMTPLAVGSYCWCREARPCSH
jgi:hypothetical protein